VFVKEDNQIDEFKSLVPFFDTDPVNFTYIKEGEAGSRMQRAIFENYQAVLIKPKKQKWLPIVASSAAEM
jgi:hypothetical protein